MKSPLQCVVHGSGTDWQAICLDLDIAAQATSPNDVTRILREAVRSYIDDAMAQDQAARDVLCSRSVPLHVRAAWISRSFVAKWLGRCLSSSGQETTLSFAIELPASTASSTRSS